MSPVSDSGRPTASDRHESGVDPSATRQSGFCEVGQPHSVHFMAHVETPHAESGVSIGPLVAGISMMVLMRRHRF